jgi:dipeptidyl-peptidase-4
MTLCNARTELAGWRADRPAASAPLPALTPIGRRCRRCVTLPRLPDEEGQFTVKPCFRTLLLLSLATCVLPVSVQAQQLDLDWLFSDAGSRAMSLPRQQWLGEAVLLYDERPEKPQRRLQRFDPATGETRDLFDSAAVLAAMNTALQPEEAFEEIGWPAAIDSAGQRAAWVRDDDIVLVDLASGELTVVADSEASEKAPRFSPNGQWLAFIRDSDLYAWHIEDGREQRLTSGGSATLRNGLLPWVYWEELMNRAERGYVWAPDSSAIAYLQSDSSAVLEAHFVDFKPDTLPRLRRQRYPQAGTDNPRVRVGVVPLASGDTTWVDLGAYPYEYLPRMQWLPDSRQLAVQTLNRDQTVLDLFVADAGSGEPRHLLRERSDSWIDVHDDLHFLAGGDEFLWRSARGGSAQLYRYNLRGELLNAVTSGPPLRASGAPESMERAVSFIDEQAGELFFTALGEDSTQRALYRVGLDGSGQVPVSAETGTHAIRFSPGGTQFLDAHSALDRLPRLQLRNRDGLPQVTLAEVDPALPGSLGLQPWERFTVAAADGTALPAMLLKPRDFDPAQRYPVVVFVYGGPSAPTVRDAWQGGRRGLYHQMLAASGAAVFLVDNRSAAARSHAETARVVRRAYGPLERADLLDGVAWLQQQPWVNAERIGIWGWSGGGTTTLSAMTGSDAFVAGVAVAPLTDLRYYDTVYAERYMKRPQDNTEGYVEVALVPKAADLHGRLLLVHGTYDDNVHPQSTWAFSDALIEADILFDMLIYPMRKHGISDDAAQRHLYHSMLEFWRRELALGEGAASAH